MQPDPDSFVHVVETDVDGIGIDGKPCKGIIVRGAKICNSNAPYVDEIVVNPTKFMGPDDADYAVAFALPGDWDGVKLMALPDCTTNAPISRPLANIGDVESLPYSTTASCHMTAYSCAAATMKALRATQACPDVRTLSPSFLHRM